MEWIKLSTGLFSDDKIVLLRSEKNGDELLVIWIRLLCMAGANDNSGTFNWTQSQFSVLMGKKSSVIRSAFEIFERLGLIRQADGLTEIVHWSRYQNIEKYNAARDKHREAQRNYRARKKESDITRDDHGDITGDITVTESDDADKNKIRREKNKEIEKNRKEITANVTRSSPGNAGAKGYQTHAYTDADFGDDFYVHGPEDIAERKFEE